MIWVSGDEWHGTYVIARTHLHIPVTILSCRNGNPTCLGVFRGQCCGKATSYPAIAIKFKELLA